MIELYLSKVTESSESEQAGKLYARVSYKETMGIHEMAEHMAHHNTAFSEGLIVGVLTDFVKCVREMVLSGNTVKVGNLAIFWRRSTTLSRTRWLRPRWEHWLRAQRRVLP